MKFIRDIIKEKRRTEVQDAPVAPLETLRRDHAEADPQPARFGMTDFDDDTFDIARTAGQGAKQDDDEDFDLFAEEEEDDFEPWSPRAEHSAPAPVKAEFEAEDLQGDTFDDPIEDDADDDAPFEDDMEPAETAQEFAAQPAFADGPLFEDDEGDLTEEATLAGAAPVPAGEPDADSIRDAVRASTADLPPMPVVTRTTPRAEVQPESGPESMPAPVAEAQVQMPPPAAGRGANRSGRVKTRLLGFAPGSEPHDPFAAPESAPATDFPVAWMVVVAGPGRGASFPLYDGVSRVGRGEDQTVSLNFGDNSISRENHLSIAYDAEDNTFYVGHSGKSNLVRLNRKPLLSTEQLNSGDQLRLGETTLRFVALCGNGFSWSAGDAGVRRNAG